MRSDDPVQDDILPTSSTTCSTRLDIGMSEEDIDEILLDLQNSGENHGSNEVKDVLDFLENENMTHSSMKINEVEESGKHGIDVVRNASQEMLNHGFNYHITDKMKKDSKEMTESNENKEKDDSILKVNMMNEEIINFDELNDVLRNNATQMDRNEQAEKFSHEESDDNDDEWFKNRKLIKEKNKNILISASAPTLSQKLLIVEQTEEKEIEDTPETFEEASERRERELQKKWKEVESQRKEEEIHLTKEILLAEKERNRKECYAMMNTMNRRIENVSSNSTINDDSIYHSKEETSQLIEDSLEEVVSIDSVEEDQDIAITKEKIIEEVTNIEEEENLSSILPRIKRNEQNEQKEKKRREMIESSLFSDRKKHVYYDASISYATLVPTLPMDLHEALLPFSHSRHEQTPERIDTLMEAIKDIVVIAIDMESLSTPIFLELFSYMLCLQSNKGIVSNISLIGVLYTVATQPFSKPSLHLLGQKSKEGKRVIYMSYQTKQSSSSILSTFEIFLSTTQLKSIVKNMSSDDTLDVYISIVNSFNHDEKMMLHQSNNLNTTEKISYIIHHPIHLFTRVPTFHEYTFPSKHYVQRLQDGKKENEIKIDYDTKYENEVLVCVVQLPSLGSSAQMLSSLFSHIYEKGLDIVGCRQLYCNESQHPLALSKHISSHLAMCIRGYNAWNKFQEIIREDEHIITKQKYQHTLTNLNLIVSCSNVYQDITWWFSGRILSENEIALYHKQQKNALNYLPRTHPVYCLIPYSIHIVGVAISGEKSSMASFFDTSMHHGYEIVGMKLMSFETYQSFQEEPEKEEEEDKENLNRLIVLFAKENGNQLTLMKQWHDNPKSTNSILVDCLSDSMILNNVNLVSEIYKIPSWNQRHLMMSMKPNSTFIDDKDEREQVALLLFTPLCFSYQRHLTLSSCNFHQLWHSLFNDKDIQLLGCKMIADPTMELIQQLLISLPYSLDENQKRIYFHQLLRGPLLLGVCRKRHLSSMFSKPNEYLSSMIDTISSSIPYLISFLQPKVVYNLISQLFDLNEIMYDLQVENQEKKYFQRISNQDKTLLSFLFHKNEHEDSLAWILIKPSSSPIRLSQILHSVLKRLTRKEYQLLYIKMIQLDMERARYIARDHATLPEFHDELNYLISNPSILIGVKRRNGIMILQEIFGNKNILQAKAQDEFSLYATYGTDEIHNGFYISSCYEDAKKDTIVFHNDQVIYENYCEASCTCERFIQAFPMGISRLNQRKFIKASKTLIETTCVILNDTLLHNGDYLMILNSFLADHFQIVNLYLTCLLPNHIEEFYSLHQSQEINLVPYQPVLILALQKENIISKCRQRIGYQDNGLFISSIKTDSKKIASCFDFFPSHIPSTLVEAFGPFLCASSSSLIAQKEILFFFSKLYKSSDQIEEDTN